jgi:hypothetical protein
MTTTPDVPDAPTPPVAAAKPKASISKGRRVLVWGLIVVASVLGVISIFASWANQQALDNSSWRTTSEKIIQNPKVATALSAYAVDQLYSNVDLAAALGDQLPPRLKPLAGPAVAALRQPATQQVHKLLSRPKLQERFIDASVLAHQKFLNVVKNETGHGITTGNGVVTLDVGQLITEVGTSLGVPSAVLSKIPASAGQIELMRSDELKAAQTGVRAVGVHDVWLAPVVLLIFATAIYLARGFRRETLRNIGWAFVLVGLAVLVLRRLGGNYVINDLVLPANRPVMHDVWEVTTSILRSIGRGIVFYGIIAILLATLAGPTRPAVAIRRWIAPTLNHRQGIAWGVAGLLYLLLVLWAPTAELSQPAWILVFAAILAFGVYALRRETLREFPDATPGSFTASLRSAWGRVRPGDSDEERAALEAGGDSAASEIARLGQLHDAGVITDEEFDRGKARALA